MLLGRTRLARKPVVPAEWTSGHNGLVTELMPAPCRGHHSLHLAQHT